MKKSLAILLALALVFSSITVAFAEETLPADAAAAKTLGMLVGSGSGVTLDYLKTNPERIQAAVMFLRLKGLEDEAKAFTGTDNFADAADAAWAAPIMAYLKANPELGWIGSGNNAFEPTKALDAKSYYKVMLEALGYKQNTAAVIGEFTWENLVEFAATKGLSKVATVTEYTVNDLATATIEALKATVKGTEKTLAAQLVDAEVITVEAAVAAGVYTVAPTVLAVESVKALNLKETVVTFNKEVDEDSAEKVGNYMLDEDDLEGTVSLNDDNKSVTITWTAGNELDNQTEYDLTVDGVAAVDGTELEEVTVTFLANDVATPVAQSLKLIGPNKLKLTFSEPIDETKVDDFSVAIEDADYDYEVATITVDGNEAIVELSDDELEEGDYSVEVTSFVDYAGLKNLKKTFTLAYAKDTTAPVATIKSASQTKVVVEFNKPVYNGEAGDAQALTEDFFYHTYSSFTPGLVVTDDNEEFTIYFKKSAIPAAESWLQEGGDDVADRPLSEGTVKFVVVADGDDNITDEWGNELEDNLSFNLSISADVTAPTVTQIKVKDDQQTIWVYFSEDIDPVDADNFTIVDEDGEDVDFSYTNYVADEDEDEYYVILTFDEDQEGEFSITIEDVVDKALEENEIAKVTKKFTVVDKTAPDLMEDDITVIGVNSDDADDHDYIYVTFEGDMATSGAYSVLDKDNYQIRTGAGTVADPYVYEDLDDDDKIATFKGNDKIKITLDDASVYDVSDGSIELVIGRVADALGNKAVTFNVAFTVTEETSPVITKVKTLDEKLIEITINGELKAVNKSYITVVNGLASGDLYNIKSWEIDDGDTIITGVLPSSLKLADSADIDLVVILDDKKFETISGTKVDTFTFGDDETVTDGYAPSIAKDSDGDYLIAKTGEKTFTITFKEDLDGTIDDLFAQDLVVKNSKGDILVAGVDYTTTAAAKVITVAIQNTSKAKVGNYKVYSNSTIKYIRDGAKNKANAFTTSFTIEDLVLVPQP